MNNPLKKITMKKYIYIFSTLLATNFAFSQVGVNTPNPQGVFNIDANKDNATSGTPTPQQQLNDVVVLANGNTGLGTTNPTTKFVINTKAVATDPTKTGFKLTDGNEATGRYLKSDANGVGTWSPINLTRSVVRGTYPSPAATVNASTAASAGPQYANVSITLAPGKWIVHSGLTIYFDGNNSTSLGDSYSLHTYLSDSNTAVTNTTFNFIGSTQMTGRMIKNTWSGSPCLIQGANVIEITGTAPVTIYVMIENKSQPQQKWRFVTNNWENYFHAIPVN